MELKTLTLTNYRNYAELTLAFSAGVTVFLGQNAQGKTNLLESIYALAFARSHRTANDNDLRRWETDFTQISGRVAQRLGTVPLQLTMTSKGKSARLNHLEQAKLSHYVGHFNIVLFAPEDLALVKGAPSVRRRFIDMEFGQVNSRYLQQLTTYRHILKQRNRYLKELQQKRQRDLVYLDVLTEQLATVGAEIIHLRHQFVAQLASFAQPIHATIANQQETLTLVYQSTLPTCAPTDAPETLATALIAEFQRLQQREIQRGTTLLGPHRDDVQFLVNGTDVAVYGSQGQQRTTALAVKLAEIDFIYAETGDYPVLLLDDVLSELDAERQTHLLLAIQDKVQTFITAPSLTDVARQLIRTPHVFHVKQGTITPEPVT